MTSNLAAPVLDVAPGIYFMFDAEGRFAGWNRAYLETFGLTAADMVAFRALDVVAPDHLEHARQAIATVLDGESLTIEVDFIVANGSRRTFYGTGLRVWHEGQPYVTGLLVDISERKQAEARLRRSHEILECVSRLLALYVGDNDAETVFSTALGDILRLTGSQYGFIAELKHEADGTPYLQSLAITRMDWNEAARRFYDENAPSGFRFSARDSLAAAVLDGAPVISNNPAHDPRSCGRMPPGHPSLDAFLGLPLARGENSSAASAWPIAPAATTKTWWPNCAPWSRLARSSSRPAAANMRDGSWKMPCAPASSTFAPSSTARMTPSSCTTGKPAAFSTSIPA